MSNDYLTTDTDLASVADAIRIKAEISGSLIFPSGFISAIQNIPSGGGAILQAKSVTITPSTSSQSQTVTPDSGYDGLSQVAISVNAVPTYNGAHHADHSITLTGSYPGNVYVGTTPDQTSSSPVTHARAGDVLYLIVIGQGLCAFTTNPDINISRIDPIEENSEQFIMPDSDLTITYAFSGGSN